MPATPALVLALFAAAADPAPHADANPLFRTLLDPGLAVTADAKVKLPPPTMPDGLPAAKQKDAIAGVIGTDYAFEDFTRNSAVAPFVLKIRDEKGGGPDAPVRAVDSFFVAHGDFARLDDEKFLDRLLNAGRGDGKGKSLTADDLAKRKIVVPAALDKRERFGRVDFDFLDRVRLEVTGRSVWSRTAESVVAAAEIDPRFAADADFPNRWRSLSKDGGELKVGPPTGYGGAGFYVKITKLADPAGAVFVEQHVVFAEPTGWFDGANLLRSKLPPVVQSNVRSMRREWAKPGK